MASAQLRTTVVLGTAIAVAAAGAALVLVLDGGDDTDDGAIPDTTTTTTIGVIDQPDPSDTTPPDQTDLVVDREDDDEAWLEPDDDIYPDHEPEFLPLPPMGIENIEFEWTVTDLIETTDGEAYINQLVEIDDTYWAVGGRYDPSLDREQGVIFTSPDGVTWETATLPSEIVDAGHPQMTVTDAAIVAVVNGWDSTAQVPILSVFTSSDAVTWVRTDPTDLVEGDGHMWINTVAGSNDVLLLIGAKETMSYEPWEPAIIEIERDGYRIQLDEADWSYLVTEIATGEVVAFGSQEEIWSGHDDQGVFDPATGETVFEMSWQDLDLAARAAYETVQWGDPMLITLTKDGRTLTIDEYTGDFTVTDESGTVVYEGSERDLWQGRPPHFTDRDGNLLVIVPWDAWEAAHNEVYGDPESYGSTPVVLRSLDRGSSWEVADLSGVVPDGFFVQTMVGGPAGFVGIGETGDMYDHHECSPVGSDQPLIVISSPDGLTWSRLDTNLHSPEWIQGLAATDSGYLATRGGPDTLSQVITSTDGAMWEPVLTQTDLELELGQVWFDRVATGDFGTFVIGGYDGYMESAPQVAMLGRHGRTLTIQFPTYTVTDDATGDVLFTFDESEFGHCEGGWDVAETGFKWGHGGFAMFDVDGTVIYAVTHRQFETAMEDVWHDTPMAYESEKAAFYLDGGTWKRVPLPELGPYGWFSGLIVGDDHVVLTVTAETHDEYSYTIRSMALVGRPAG